MGMASFSRHVGRDGGVSVATDAGTYGVAHQVGVVADSEFLHQTHLVRADCLGAEGETVRDLGERTARGDELQDCAFARRDGGPLGGCGLWGDQGIFSPQGWIDVADPRWTLRMAVSSTSESLSLVTYPLAPTLRARDTIWPSLCMVSTTIRISG